MTNLRMIVVNHADDATLSASPAVEATLPVTNLQNLSRARVMRSTSTADQAVLGEWASARVLSGLALGRHNLTGVATLRFQGWDGAGQSGNMVLDTTPVPAVPAIPWGVLQWGVDPWGGVDLPEDVRTSTVWFTSLGAADSVAVRSWKLTISDSANPDGYIQASRLVMGHYITPAVNASYGAALQWPESTQQIRTAGGTLRSDPADPHRRLVFNLDHLNEAERAKFSAEMRRVGKRDDFLISLFPETGGRKEYDHSFIAKAVESPEFSIRDRHPRSWQSRYVFEEA